MSISGPGYFMIGPVSISQTTITSFIVTVILCVAGILLGRNLKKRPGGMQVMTEKGVDMIYGLVEEAMGKHNSRWTPFIATLFLSSMLGSLLGMTGVLKSSTADVSTTAVWAVTISVICWYQSIKNFGLGAWLKGFTEPIAVMTPMNIVSEIAQPVSLAFRHFGNIAGGGVITTMIYYALSGASLGLTKLIASSHIAVTCVLLVVGVVLFFFVKPKSGKRTLPRIVGAVCGVLGLLSAAQFLSNLIGFTYPEPTERQYWLWGIIYFVCIIAIVAGIFLAVSNKKKWQKPVGIVLFVLGFAGIVYTSGGPLAAPVLTAGIPAILSLYFDVFSGLIQAFVFSLLSMIYISNACPPPEECKPRKRKKQKTAEPAIEESN